MVNMKQKGFISSPGRICLFGEHQAINRRLRLHYQLHKGTNQIELQSNQLKYSEKFSFRIKEKLQDYGESFITRMDSSISAH